MEIAMSTDREPRLEIDSDFEYLLTFLPPAWNEAAKKLGALRRCRKFSDAKVLLRILLLHLAEGCSLRETAVRARQGNLADISDVAIMDRLRLSGEWFRWMNTELMARWISCHPRSVFGERSNVRVVDGTQVKEPGPTGSSWRIHYSVALPSLRCSAVEVTGSQGNASAETFGHFHVNRGDLFIGDRAYGLVPGIAHVVKGGGDVLVRFGWSTLPLWRSSTKRFDLFARLHRLHGAKIGDWPVGIKDGPQLLAGRVCAVKKSRQAAAKARRDVLRKAQKHSAQILPETLDAASYVFVFTTVPSEQLVPSHVLEFYRGRWQVELVFKRLKSLIGFGHLRKRDDQSAKAWIQGKLFVAFLLEALLRRGESFFPWGYPILSD
jgi:hypothetical protein